MYIYTFILGVNTISNQFKDNYAFTCKLYCHLCLTNLIDFQFGGEEEKLWNTK